MAKQKAGIELVQIDLNKVLRSLDLTYEQFVDLCILCGSDYTNTISGIGPVKAYKYIQECKNIEKVIQTLNNELVNAKEGKKPKFIIPNEYPY